MQEKRGSNIWTHKQFVRLFFIISLLTTLFIFSCTESSDVTPVGPPKQAIDGSTSSEIPHDIPNDKEDVEGVAVNVEDVVEDPIPENNPIEDPPEDGQEKLRIGVFVIVQNVNQILENGRPHGLHTRGKPRLGVQFITGHVFNGAIGEIVDGPVENDNHIWWKIHWNRDNPKHIVTWIPGLEEVCRQEFCTVWSAQFVKEVKGPVLIRK